MSAITFDERPVHLETGKRSSGPISRLPRRGDTPAPSLPVVFDDVCIDGREVAGCFYCTGPETD